MFLKDRLQRSILSSFLLFTFIFATLPVRAQVIVPGSIAGGTGKYVITGQPKKGSYSSRRTSTAKRTAKQRSSTRRKVVRQSQASAKKNRDRRDIKEVTPDEYERLDINRMPKDEASKVLAGAGEYYVTRDEVDNAVTYLEGAVELDPDNGDAKLALSEVYATLGDRALVKADEYTELAIKASSENDTTARSRNETLSLAETGKAERYYIAAVNLDDKNPSAHVGLGQFYDSQNRDAEAKRSYEKALALDPSLAEVKGPLGIIYFEEGEIASADELISEALAAEPENAEVQFFSGVINYKKNENETSERALKKSISIDSENPESHYYLGAVFSRMDRQDDAIEEFEKAVVLDSRFVNAWFDLGVAYFNKGEFEKAANAFENAIRYNNDQTEELKRINDESYANLAEAYRQVGKLDLSISRYRIAVARQPENAELMTTYGFALGERDLWETALASFQKAAALDNDSVGTTTNLGWAHYKTSQFYAVRNYKDKQRASLETALTILRSAERMASSGSSDADLNLAATKLYLGIVLNDLGLIDNDPNRYREAIEVLKQSIDLSDSKWVAAINELGIAYRKNNELKKAISQFKKAMDMQDDYVFAIFNLSEAEFQDGNDKEARKLRDRVARLDTRLAAELDNIFRRGRNR